MEQTLELQVINQTAGILETNIDSLEVFVDKKLLEFEPDNYLGDADTAKKDRAVLNNSKKLLSQSRINIVKELMKPYEDFEKRCKNLEKKIDTASGKLDEIVKVKEQQEKDIKKSICQMIWNRKEFNLFPMDKVFNPKWLNKTFKEKDIEAEIDGIVNKVYSDLKLIEKFSEDAEFLKSLYLEDLNLDEVFSRADELEKNRQLVKEEELQRDIREHKERLSEQEEILEEEKRNYRADNTMKNLVADALDKPVEAETEKNYVLSFHATKEQEMALKQFLFDEGITYDSLEEITF